MIKIEIQDPARGEPQDFPNEAAAIVWLQDEISTWERVLSRFEVDETSPCATPLRQWREVRYEIDQVRRRRADVPEELVYVEKDLQNRNVLINSIYGRSLVLVLTTLGPEAADFAAIHARLADGEFDWKIDAAFRGAMLFDQNRRSSVEYFENELDQSNAKRRAEAVRRTDSIMESIAKLDEMVSSLANSTSQQREQINAELKIYKLEATESFNSLIGQSRTIQATNNSMLVDAESRLKSAIETAEKTVANWTLAHNEQRQLETPATLWADRAVTHSSNSDRWRTWSIVIAIFGLALAVLIAVLSFKWSQILFNAAMIPGIPVNIKTLPGTLRPTFHYELIFTGAVSLAWLTMYLWAMRLVVRLYTTEQHLAIDASARGAMMEAYLGLIKADAANATDRPIVLQALFRPVQDGMVRDDGPPGITPAALLSALATSQGKG